MSKSAYLVDLRASIFLISKRIGAPKRPELTVHRDGGSL